MRQLPGVQDGFNRKGLISNDGEKKEAFFVLQKTYKEWALHGPVPGDSQSDSQMKTASAPQ